MSGNKKNSNSNDGAGGGLGLGTAVLVGAGAAAIGFLAGKVWNNYQEMQSELGNQSSSSGPNSRRPSCTAADWEQKEDQNLGARKKLREAFHDLKAHETIPDEMKCIICCDNPREICLVPCGHVVLCEDCAEKIDTKCPMCQQKYNAKKVIYM